VVNIVEKKRLNKITEDIISGGAAVINDLPDNVTAVGVPAKVLKQHSDLT